MTTKLRVYDNGGKTMDRYTIIPARQFWRTHRCPSALWDALGCGVDPVGISYGCSARPGRHLGKRVAFDALPEAVQACARRYFSELFS